MAIISTARSICVGGEAAGAGESGGEQHPSPSSSSSSHHCTANKNANHRCFNNNYNDYDDGGNKKRLLHEHDLSRLKVNVAVVDGRLNCNTLMKRLHMIPVKRRGVRRQAAADPAANAVLHAIEFKLQVSHCGRSYHAVRSLWQIVRLQTKLARERSSPNRSSSGSGTTTTAAVPDIPNLLDHGNSNNTTTTTTTTTTSSSRSSKTHSLDERVLASCPILQGWFMYVLDELLLHSSPCLLKFLREPVSSEAKTIENDNLP